MQLTNDEWLIAKQLAMRACDDLRQLMQMGVISYDTVTQVTHEIADTLTSSTASTALQQVTT